MFFIENNSIFCSMYLYDNPIFAYQNNQAQKYNTLRI
jgi:hypothetical protein